MRGGEFSTGIVAAITTAAFLGILGVRFGSYTQLPVSIAIPMGQLQDAGGTSYSQIFKFGKNPAVTGSAEDVWDCSEVTGATTYPFPTTAQSLYVSSDDEGDAGLGITVIGLDSAWTEQTVTATLGDALASGTASALVGTASNWMRVYRAFNSDSDGTAYSGNIYLSTDDDAEADGVPDSGATQILACILIGEGQTQMAIYTVPDGFTALLVASSAGINPTTGANTRSADVDLLSRLTGRAWRVQEHMGLQTNGTGEVIRNYFLYRSFPARTDIKWRSADPSASAEINATFSLILAPSREFQ